MKDNIYEAYREVKDEEQEHPFRERHHNLNKNFYREYAKKADTVPKVIVFYMAKGTAHVTSEFLYQIDKLKYFTQDSIPKYVIRNRNMAGVVLSAVILTNIIGGTSVKTAPVPDLPVTTIEETVDEEMSTIETAQENTTIILTRNYTVQGGDTLSALSYESGSSMAAINNMNGYSNDNDRIYYKDTMKIPYAVNLEDLQYYTQTITVNNKSLSDIADDFNTDVETLIRLNSEAIETIQGSGYIIMSDTLIVPNFISKDELYEMKNNTEYETTNQYTKNN
jgi:LysM repeat protein